MKILSFGLACCSVASAAPIQQFVPGEIWPGDDGRYVWLPIRWEDGGPVLEWRDRWDLSLFDQE